MNLTRRAAIGATLAPLLPAATRPALRPLPQGLWPVMLTPFKADKSIDWKALDALTDWYLANGAQGLFACCLSSEVYQLTEQERLEVTARVIKRAGRTPVVAAGVPGWDPKVATPFVAKLNDMGVHAVVLIVCQMAEKTEDDATWKRHVEGILEASGRTPFGVYEAPSPYRRYISPELMGWMASTGRFLFEKDTTCNLDAIKGKLAVLGSSPLRVFNAHSPILIDAVRAGGHGFSGICANAYPQLCTFMLDKYKTKPEAAERVQTFVRENEPTLNKFYPASTKILANLAGIPITPVCRKRDYVIGEADVAKLRALRSAADALVPLQSA